MSSTDVRNFDVVIAQAPQAAPWPTVGARAIASLCAEVGLKVAVMGGEDLSVRGVLPLEGTGALVLAQDAQNRIHQIKARALVRVVPPGWSPQPFPGWISPGLIPLATARKLKDSGEVAFSPAVVILGTGNKALRFGSELIEEGRVPSGGVFCIEQSAQWGAKRFSGWEVERRRFEMVGGKILEAQPVELRSIGPLLYEMRLKDLQGVRVLQVSRVVAVGPYIHSYPVREYPPGSLLFEFEQSAEELPEQDIEGWILEDERARFLAGRLIRALVSDLGDRKEDLDLVLNQARLRLKKMVKHREVPFTPSYQGKWTAGADMALMRQSSGVPKTALRLREVASVECFEEIACNLCARACPYDAISIGRIPRDVPILNEDRCTACGICVAACPSRSVVLVQETDARPTARIVLPWRKAPKGSEAAHVWKEGEFAVLLNRRGESLGNGRVVDVTQLEGIADTILLRLEVPAHVTWEARAVRPPQTQAVADPVYLAAMKKEASDRVEISFQGEKRWVRPEISISQALFEVGRARPEDVLLCRSGECGRCASLVDGVKKLSCQTHVHQGMSVRLPDSLEETNVDYLCVCERVTEDAVRESLSKGGLSTPDAVAQATCVGAGRCHGQLCMEPFRRLLIAEGMDASRWIDWRFPWMDWVLKPQG